jgi:hypothetical protein
MHFSHSRVVFPDGQCTHLRIIRISIHGHKALNIRQRIYVYDIMWQKEVCRMQFVFPGNKEALLAAARRNR